MFIKSLKLHNFKNINDLEITNWSRINGILGRNGQGKTSIIHALRLVILANTPKKFKLSDFIGDFDTKFEIYCSFSHLDVDYDFYMSYDGNSSEKKLKMSNSEDDLINSQVNNYMNKLFDPALTLNSAFSSQNETALILEQDPAERLNQLKKILLDKETLDEKESLLDNRITETKNEIFKVEKEIDLLGSKEFKFEDELTFEDNREELKIEIEKYKDKQNNIKIQLNAYEKLINTYTKKQNEYQEQLKDYYNKINLIDKEYNEILSEYSEYEYKLKEYDSYLSEINNFEQNKIELVKKIKQLNPGRLKVCKYSEDDYRAQKDRVNKSVLSLTEIDKQIKWAEEGKCFNCGTKWEGDSLDKLLTKKNEMQTEYNNLDIELKNIEKELDDYKAYKNKIDQINFQIEEYKKQLEGLKQPEIIEKPEEIQKPIKQQYPIKPEFDEQQPQKPNLDENYDKLISECEKKILDIEFKHKENEKIKQRNSIILDQKQQNENKLEENKSLLNKLLKKQDILKKSKRILKKDFPVFIINLGIFRMRMLINKFFSNVYGKYIINMKANEKGDGIDILFDNGFRERNISVASGSEKQICATALRFSLCKLQNIGLYIGDEIDSNADMENSEKLLEEVYNNKDFEQIILISHNENTKEILSNLDDCNIINF